MVKRTYRNFLQTIEVLQNQCYMTAADAERRTRQIFDSVDVRLYVTLGGPTCWIDTEKHAVICYWGTDRAEYAIDWDLCDEIEEIIAEYMELDFICIEVEVCNNGKAHIQ